MKASKATVLARIEKVFAMRLRGADFGEIRRYAAMNQPENGLPWNLSDRQLQRYIARADELFARSLERDRERTFARHVAQRRLLYGHALHASDYRTALAILQDEGRLHDLYPATKIAPTDPSGTSQYDGGVGGLIPALRAAVDRIRQEAGSGAASSDPAVSDY